MAKASGAQVEAVLEKFIETVFKLMMDHHQKQILELDLTMPQAQALKLLHRAPLCTGELAAELKISAPAVTQLTDRLTRKRLIERRSRDGDRRTVILKLTGRGRRAVDRFRQHRNSIFSGALAHLNDMERAEVVLALGKVLSALERFEDQTAAAPLKASNANGRARRQAQAAGR